MELLLAELEALQLADVDLASLGFAPEELAAILAPAGTEGLTDPDDAPEPPDEAVTRPGDLWILGRHRLLCGDSGSVADLDRLLDGEPVDLVNTDPPYNVKVEPRSNNAIAAGLSSFQSTHHQKLDVERHFEKAKGTTRKMRAKDRPLANDFVTDEAFDALLGAWFGNASRVLKPGGSFYIWGGYANLGNYQGPLADAGLYFSQAIVWDKQHPVYRQEGLCVGRHKPRRHRSAVTRPEGTKATQVNERWSMDFMADQLFDGRKFRLLTLVDDFTRESLAIELDQRLTGERVAMILDGVGRGRGLPGKIRVDNGSEFTGKVLDQWASMNGVRLDFSRRGKPTDNGLIEAFNGRLRAECLNENWFMSLDDARSKVEAWRRHYNEDRPHSALGNLAPREFAASTGQASLAG